MVPNCNGLASGIAGGAGTGSQIWDKVWKGALTGAITGFLFSLGVWFQNNWFSGENINSKPKIDNPEVLFAKVARILVNLKILVQPYYCCKRIRKV